WGLARVSCAAADEHAVHIDVIENCGTERIGGSVGVLGLVKYDRYPLNSTGDRNKRECRRVESHHDACRAPAKPRPAVSDCLRIRRRRATAHEEETRGGADVEAGRACAAMGTYRACAAQRPRLPDVIAQFG